MEALYHGKCAWCERKLDLHIDHYRSKSLYDWAGYQWSNLLPICSECNVRKRGAFPLEDKSPRLHSPQSLADCVADSAFLLAENPLLIHPEIDDPADYLGYFADGRVHDLGIGGKGTATIEVLQLNWPYVIIA